MVHHFHNSDWASNRITDDAYKSMLSTVMYTALYMQEVGLRTLIGRLQLLSVLIINYSLNYIFQVSENTNKLLSEAT